MPIQSLSIGTRITITGNVIYALPAKACTISASAAFQIGNDGTSWELFSVPQKVVSGYKFIRSANPNNIVISPPLVGGLLEIPDFISNDAVETGYLSLYDAGAAPSSPFGAANLYTLTVGGKVKLYVLFPTGVAIQLATEV